jgi:hypothetical protein
VLLVTLFIPEVIEIQMLLGEWSVKRDPEMASPLIS